MGAIPDFESAMDLIAALERSSRASEEFLLNLADKLDGWAVQSRTGGWSTHQVSANREAANECRRQAAAIRVAIPR